MQCRWNERTGGHNGGTLAVRGILRSRRGSALDERKGVERDIARFYTSMYTSVITFV